MKQRYRRNWYYEVFSTNFYVGQAMRLADEAWYRDLDRSFLKSAISLGQLGVNDGIEALGFKTVKAKQQRDGLLLTLEFTPEKLGTESPVRVTFELHLSEDGNSVTGRYVEVEGHVHPAVLNFLDNCPFFPVHRKEAA